jgi:hypothetical protein
MFGKRLPVTIIKLILTSLSTRNYLEMCCLAPFSWKLSNRDRDTVNERGLEQLLGVFIELPKQATKTLSSQCSERGDLVAIDGSLIASVLSMHRAEYRTHSKTVSIRRVWQLRNQIRNEANQQSTTKKSVPQHRKRKTKGWKRFKKPHASS